MTNYRLPRVAELALIVALSVPFLFWGMGSFGFMDPDEGMYGTIARSMAESGDWVTPRFNGIRYLEKPPLFFWLSSITMVLFGPSEWAARLWSALPAFGSALLLWRMGDLIYGRGAGFLSALMMISSVGVFRYARVAATDFLLVFSITLAIYGFVLASRLGSGQAKKPFSVEASQPPSLPAFQQLGAVLFWLGISLGVLSKGLIGIVFPLLIVALWAMVNYHLLNVQRSRFNVTNDLITNRLSPFAICYSLFANPLGLSLFLGLTVPWHFLAAMRNPGFFDFYIVDNQFLRFLSSRAFIEDDVPVTTLGFLLLTFVWFFPWSLFLGAGLKEVFPKFSVLQEPAERLRLLVGIWVLGILGFFSLTSSKLEHYFLPVVPPLSLMVGGLWSGISAAPKSIRSSKSSLISVAVGSSLAGISLIILSEQLEPQAVLAGLAELNVYYRILKDQGAVSPFPSVAPFAPLVKGVGAILLFGLPSALFLLWNGWPRASFAAAVIIASFTAALVFRLLMIIEPHHSVKEVAFAIERYTASGAAIVHEGSLEYSGGLPFYTGRNIFVLNGKRGDLDFGSRYPETKHLYLDDKKFQALWTGEGKAFLVTREQVKDSVVKRTKNLQFRFIGRYGSRLLFYANGKS